MYIYIYFYIYIYIFRYSMLHVDEGSTFTFHYSSVIYLSSQPAAGGGGDFVFSDTRPSPGIVSVCICI